MDHSLVENLPRRKLFLKRRVEKSDLSKALIVYQPFDKSRYGRNLAFFSTPSNSEVQNPPQPKEQKTKLKESSSSSPNQLNVIICLSLVLCLIYFGYDSLSSLFSEKNCQLSSVTINLELLSKQLYGQPTAIHLIKKELEELEVTIDHLAVFILLGGIGTGKTWTIQLVRIFIFVFNPCLIVIELNSFRKPYPTMSR